jgi:hypothetical protein
MRLGCHIDIMKIQIENTTMLYFRSDMVYHRQCGSCSRSWQ